MLSECENLTTSSAGFTGHSSLRYGFQHVVNTKERFATCVKDTGKDDDLTISYAMHQSFREHDGNIWESPHILSQFNVLHFLLYSNTFFSLKHALNTINRNIRLFIAESKSTTNTPTDIQVCRRTYTHIHTYAHMHT